MKSQPVFRSGWDLIYFARKNLWSLEGMILYDSFSNSYFTLGEKVGKAWGEGRQYMK